MRYLIFLVLAVGLRLGRPVKGISITPSEFRYPIQAEDSASEGKNGLPYERLVEPAQYPGGDVDEVLFPAGQSLLSRTGCCTLEQLMVNEDYAPSNSGFSQLGAAFTLFLILDIVWSPSDDQLPPVFDGVCETGWQYTRHRRQTGYPMTHINDATSWLDLSQLYGQTEADRVRMRDWDKPYLLRLTNELQFPIQCVAPVGVWPFIVPSLEACIGDMRVNHYVPMVGLATVFAREHNRIATRLRADNSSLSNDEVFEVARSYVVAQYQNIIVREWLPQILGLDAAATLEYLNDLQLPSGRLAIWEEVGATLPKALWGLFTPNVDIITNDSIRVDYDLKEYVRNSGFLVSNGMEATLRGQLKSAAGRWDLNFATDLSMSASFNTRKALHIPAEMCYSDRDHGLPDYIPMYEFLNQETHRSYDQTTVSNQVVDLLKRMYPHLEHSAPMENVDFVIGSLAEDPVAEAVLGKSISKLLARQIQMIRREDSRWIHQLCDRHVFTTTECEAIYETTLSRLLLRNTGYNCIQTNAFRAGVSVSPDNRICRPTLRSVLDMYGSFVARVNCLSLECVEDLLNFPALSEARMTHLNLILIVTLPTIIFLLLFLMIFIVICRSHNPSDRSDFVTQLPTTGNLSV